MANDVLSLFEMMLRLKKTKEPAESWLFYILGCSSVLGLGHGEGGLQRIINRFQHHILLTLSEYIVLGILGGLEQCHGNGVYLQFSKLFNAEDLAKPHI